MQDKIAVYFLILQKMENKQQQTAFPIPRIGQGLNIKQLFRKKLKLLTNKELGY